MPKEGLAVDLYALVEGEAEILRERALARSVEARDPDPDLVPAAGFHGRLNILQQPLELVLDAVGDDVLSDLRLQPLFLRSLIRDHLFDRPVYALIGVEQRADLGHTQ